MTKRIFDTLGAFCGLVVCAPLFVVIAFLIKMDSQGPVLFKQVRVGRGFRQFCLYKFRTMVQGRLAKWGDAYHRRGSSCHPNRAVFASVKA